MGKKSAEHPIPSAGRTRLSAPILKAELRPRRSFRMVSTGAFTCTKCGSAIEPLAVHECELTEDGQWQKTR